MNEADQGNQAADLFLEVAIENAKRVTGNGAKRLLYGVGINDANYLISSGEVVDGKWKELGRCPYYAAWKGMLMRCYSDKYREKHPTYSGCKVCPGWLIFTNFREWMEKQDWMGKQLDKDLLIAGNKIYSPETCVFVSSELNHFLMDGASRRGKYPIGSCFHSTRGKFMSNCRNPFTGKNEYLGLFKTADEAHKAWKARKNELACAYADLQNDERVAGALRERYS